MTKIEFTNEELQALVSLMDAGVKAIGLRGVKGAAVLLAKIEQAIDEANKAAADDNVINFEDKDVANG